MNNTLDWLNLKTRVVDRSAIILLNRHRRVVDRSAINLLNLRWDRGAIHDHPLGNRGVIHNQGQRRRGAAFLLLIFVVLLVVLGATQTMVRSEMTHRRGEQGRLRVRSMQAAIDAVQTTTGNWQQPLRLPVRPESNEVIEVTANRDTSTVVARWLRGDQLLDQMTQNLALQTESGE